MTTSSPTFKQLKTKMEKYLNNTDIKMRMKTLDKMAVDINSMGYTEEEKKLLFIIWDKLLLQF